MTELGLSLKSLHEIKLRYQQGKLGEDYIQFVLLYYDQLQHKARIRSLAGAVYKAMIFHQLANEFKQWKESQPVYKAPAVIKRSNPVSEDLISLEDLRSGWEALNKKGMANHATFEDSLEQYKSHPDYRFENREGIEYLIYIKRD